MKDKEFINGFNNWIQTYFEITYNIVLEIRHKEPCKMVSNTFDKKGHTGLYDLADELTDEFETNNKGKEWDGEFYDEIDKFIEKKFGRLL